MLSPKQCLSIFLACLMIVLPAWSAPQSGGQRAGQITALMPTATRNTDKAKVNDDLHWNDLLKTGSSGRLRAGLTDGSILSLGSDSELRVVQHDASSQQTSLELTYGKVRSQVQKITQPGGKYEVKTPNAVIGVIGTDFYVGYDGNTTTVICYEGQVAVTAGANAQVQNNTGQGGASGNSVVLNAGEMVEITTIVPPGGYHAAHVPPSVAQNGILSTTVTEKEPRAYNPEHTGRWVALGFAVAAGLALGLTQGLDNGNGKKPCAPIVGVANNPCR